jgi:hypothetical protein
MSVLISDAKDLSLQLPFRLAQSRISHLRKTFLESSPRFHEIGYIREVVIGHEVLVGVLTRATFRSFFPFVSGTSDVFLFY